MPKLAVAQGKLERVKEQIQQAEDESQALVSEIEAVDGKLSIELAKVNLDEEKVGELEGEREAFVRTQTRLAIRIKALSETLPDTEKILNEAQLKDAIARHPDAIQAVNEAVAQWREKGKAVAELAEAGKVILDKKYALNKVVSKVQYLSTVLGKERPRFGSTDDVKREDADPLQRNFRLAFNVNCDPYVRNEFDEKLTALDAKKREAKQAKAAAQSSLEAKQQGW